MNEKLLINITFQKYELMLERFIDNRSTLNNISLVDVRVLKIAAMYAYSSICRRDVHIITFLFIISTTLHPRDNASLIHSSCYLLPPLSPSLSWNSLGEESQARLSSTKKICDKRSRVHRASGHADVYFWSKVKITKTHSTTVMKDARWRERSDTVR